jgi:hypothetical protein
VVGGSRCTVGPPGGWRSGGPVGQKPGGAVAWWASRWQCGGGGPHVLLVYHGVEKPSMG